MDIVGLIPSFGGLLWTLAAFIIALSIIVAIHEYGHYIVGKWCGIKADVFSVGFGKVLASRVDKHGTKWQIAALPFGGYVKFFGDAGAASDKDSDFMETLTEEELRSTMHGAPLWARALTVAAGPVFNFILSFILFFGLIMHVGVAGNPITVDELKPLPSSSAYDLQNGDILLEIDGQPVPDVDEYQGFQSSLTPAPILKYTVEREGEVVTVDGPWVNPPIVYSVTPGWAADKAGMREGDVIVGVDGDAVYDFEQMRQTVVNSGGRELTISIWREGEDVFDLKMTPQRRDLPLPASGNRGRDGGFAA